MIADNQNFTPAQSAILKAMVHSPGNWRCPFVNDEAMLDDLAWLAEHGFIVSGEWDWLPSHAGWALAGGMRFTYPG